MRYKEERKETKEEERNYSGERKKRKEDRKRVGKRGGHIKKQ